MAQSIITLKNVSYAYEDKQVLQNINLDITSGMFMGLVGPNGGGKTTLLKIILGLLQPSEGAVEILNQPVRQFKNWSHIGFVSQKANAFNSDFPATVYEVVAMGRTAKIGYFKFMNRHDKQKVLQAIEQVGMGSYAYQKIGQLSGGQQQRVFIARALVNDPQILILDEPTVGVDTENMHRFYTLLGELNQKNKITLLLVTHDTTLLNKYANKIVHLNQTLQMI